jgi:hypothetical protein
MNRHVISGILVGGVFAALITWIACLDTLEEGGFALLTTAVFGLAAGLCIGGLIAANFALMGLEEKESHGVPVSTEAAAHSPA